MKLRKMKISNLHKAPYLNQLPWWQ